MSMYLDPDVVIEKLDEENKQLKRGLAAAHARIAELEKDNDYLQTVLDYTQEA